MPPQISEGRKRRAEALLRAARGQHDIESIERILRDHLDGGIAWAPGATPAEERFFTLCAHSEPVHWTTASMVAPLPADRSTPWPVWVSFGTPCTGIFLPVYLEGVIPASLARGGEEPEADSAWWVMKGLQDAAASDPVRHTPVLREGWSDLEERIEAERMRMEAGARRAASAGDRDRAAAIATEFMASTVEEALKRAEELRARIA